MSKSKSSQPRTKLGGVTTPESMLQTYRIIYIPHDISIGATCDTADKAVLSDEDLKVAIDSFDVLGQALVVATEQTFTFRTFHGRKRISWFTSKIHPIKWCTLEHKCKVSELWRQCSQVPDFVVPDESIMSVTKIDDVIDTCNKMNRMHNQGIVMAADDECSLIGGASLVFYCTCFEQVKRVLSKLTAKNIKAVRLMPFYPGTPVELTGMVVQGSVIAAPPEESVCLRSLHSEQLLCFGPSSVWKPAKHVAERLAALTRAIGQELKSIGYLGCYNLNGIWTELGFVPTEVNPRPPIPVAVA
mmetsp:Transcript_8280/g.29076  ORF Transcript_8280/g.29076 Transcript_8280/m.29076 type:complete len:301 (-) Transcript_8280:194-1096(-)